MIPESLRVALRRWMFTSIDLTWQTQSGIALRIEQYADWTIYNEIFVDGDYDRGIALALDFPRRPLQIVDLGANVGFFSLRAFDCVLQRGLSRDAIRITAVEADPLRAASFEKRVCEENALRQQLQLTCGLVGKRSGTGQLVKDCWSVTDKTRHAVMPYVDLSPLLESVDCIDLLKCDIEGAEAELIDSYPELLSKTQTAVFEFHARRCSVEQCLARLYEHGFTHHAARRPDSDYPVYTLWR